MLGLSFIMACNVLRVGEGGDFTTEHYTKHTLQIYEKLSYEALPRHFCQLKISKAKPVLYAVFFYSVQ
jgi:hypothetical protein